jgi:hypothetical protein
LLRAQLGALALGLRPLLGELGLGVLAASLLCALGGLALGLGLLLLKAALARQVLVVENLAGGLLGGAGDLADDPAHGLL